MRFRFSCIRRAWEKKPYEMSSPEQLSSAQLTCLESRMVSSVVLWTVLNVETKSPFPSPINLCNHFSYVKLFFPFVAGDSLVLVIQPGK